MGVDVRTGSVVTLNSLNNVNVVSSDEVKPVCRNVDTNKKRKRGHIQRNNPFKILILFIK